jgi:GTP cyclohydrolase II
MPPAGGRRADVHRAHRHHRRGGPGTRGRKTAVRAGRPVTRAAPSLATSGSMKRSTAPSLRSAAALQSARTRPPSLPPQVPCRVHDACFTSEVLGSLKCDCREQLALAMDRIQADPPGMVIYLQQEGRGIGLANKIAAYALQVRCRTARSAALCLAVRSLPCCATLNAALHEMLRCTECCALALGHAAAPALAVTSPPPPPRTPPASPPHLPCTHTHVRPPFHLRRRRASTRWTRTARWACPMTAASTRPWHTSWKTWACAAFGSW